MFGYYKMDRRQKNILRDYFNFRDIRTIRAEAQVDTNDNAWQLLRETYNQLVPPAQRIKKVKKKVKVKVAPLAVRQRAAQNKRRQDALKTITSI